MSEREVNERAVSAGVVIEAAARRHRDGLVRLFEATSSPCFCRFWHFTGTNNAWLERCAGAPSENRDELDRALEEGSDEARGVVALEAGGGDSGDVVGWMKVAPATVMKKLYDR